jgi:hypothetical protein
LTAEDEAHKAKMKSVAESCLEQRKMFMMMVMQGKMLNNSFGEIIAKFDSNCSSKI